MGICTQASDNWTKVTFSPDLSKFSMTELEPDTVALMRKRVYDMAGILGKGVKARDFHLSAGSICATVSVTSRPWQCCASLCPITVSRRQYHRSLMCEAECFADKAAWGTKHHHHQQAA